MSTPSNHGYTLTIIAFQFWILKHSIAYFWSYIFLIGEWNGCGFNWGRNPSSVQRDFRWNCRKWAAWATKKRIGHLSKIDTVYIDEHVIERKISDALYGNGSNSGECSGTTTTAIDKDSEQRPNLIFNNCTFQGCSFNSKVPNRGVATPQRGREATSGGSWDHFRGKISI